MIDDMRIGQGMDAHRFADGRDLVLCGVKVPHDRGLDGHSDADVAVHALMDAILGALALGDIGKWFPDTDQKHKGADSLKLLESILSSPRLDGWRIVNLDVTIVAQRPKLAPFSERMRGNLARVVGCGLDRVSVKATTTEKMGFCGREEGVAALAVVLMARTNQQ